MTRQQQMGWMFMGKILVIGKKKRVHYGLNEKVKPTGSKDTNKTEAARDKAF